MPKFQINDLVVEKEFPDFILQVVGYEYSNMNGYCIPIVKPPKVSEIDRLSLIKIQDYSRLHWLHLNQETFTIHPDYLELAE